ncbi:rhomboid family intramembrane serine protease [bacterium]|nr:rhomboid family intramembrane serine protease [bacterium]
MYTTQRMQFGYGNRMTEGVKRLLIINVAVFVLQWFGGRFFIDLFGLTPRLTWSRFYIWQFFTYMFLHGNLLHIAFNMYALWVFGTEVERMWGTRVFYRYYVITGVGAGIIHTLVTPLSLIPTIGASGAVMGVLLAFGMLFPNRQVTMLLFFILPLTLRAKHLVMLFAGISVLSGVAGSPDGVAHFAHLGGMLVGYIYIKGGLNRVFSSLEAAWRNLKRRYRMNVKRNEQQDLDKLKRIVDTILDKANTVGYDNLTRDEKAVLKKASKIFRKDHEKE